MEHLAPVVMEKCSITGQFFFDFFFLFHCNSALLVPA